MPSAFIAGCAGLALSADERAFFRDSDPWGLILFKRNVDNREQLRALTGAFRDCVGRADAPVLIDQEGGRVQRMGPPNWRAYPAAARFEAALAPHEAEAAARLAGRLIAHDLREAGITVDCAPVLDVSEAGTHAVIGARAWSDDPGRVAALGRADSHFELPTVTASRAELERDFAPFAALSDLPMAMTAHVVYAALDSERPATTSPVIVRDILRGALGFDGLIMTDDLSMKALGGPFDERARRALAAGVDMVLHCNGVMEEARAVASAVPALSGAPLRRAEAALAAIRAPEPFDRAEAERHFAALMDAAPAA